jgi:hypothetical protein
MSPDAVGGPLALLVPQRSPLVSFRIRLIGLIPLILDGLPAAVAFSEGVIRLSVGSEGLHRNLPRDLEVPYINKANACPNV